MDFIDTLPIWALALLIFSLRNVDVSLGTCRTIAVVQGRIATSVFLGFLEVLVWVTTVAQVIQHASKNPWLLLAYSCGFSAGTAAGIMLERKIALGGVILRIVSRTAGEELSASFRQRVPRVISFEGDENGEPMCLLYVVVRRREAKRLIEEALRIDPNLYYAVDLLRDSNWKYDFPPPTPTGWRGAFKMK